MATAAMVSFVIVILMLLASALMMTTKTVLISFRSIVVILCVIVVLLMFFDSMLVISYFTVKTVLAFTVLKITWDPAVSMISFIGVDVEANLGTEAGRFNCMDAGARDSHDGVDGGGIADVGAYHRVMLVTSAQIRLMTRARMLLRVFRPDGLCVLTRVIILVALMMCQKVSTNGIGYCIF